MQLNQATADLDLSPLYGFTESARQRMRSHTSGFLKSTPADRIEHSLLPRVTDDVHRFCVHASGLKSCFMAGDSRVNSNPFTIAIYTIFMRNHNRLANELKRTHPLWDDEQLYNRAKAINSEIYRRVVFDEWLPIVLGPALTDEIVASRSQKVPTGGVDEQAQVSNEYAVAAARFYLSMMPNALHSSTQALDANAESARDGGYSSNTVEQPMDIFSLKDQLYTTNISYTSNKLDDILGAVLQQRAMRMDNFYVESVRFFVALIVVPCNICY